jgi:hypothetical protein
MRVHLSRTGGFAGLGQAASVDEASLEPEERDKLRRLVADADLWSLAPEPPGSPPAPDRFRYRITAEDGERRQEIRVSEDSLPEGLRPLVRWLEERARSGRG